MTVYLYQTFSTSLLAVPMGENNNQEFFLNSPDEVQRNNNYGYCN